MLWHVIVPGSELTYNDSNLVFGHSTSDVIVPGSELTYNDSNLVFGHSTSDVSW